MEGTVIRSQFGFSRRSAALASSRTTHRSRQVTTAVSLQKTETTPDYLRSLLYTAFPVDSPLGSFSPVLPVPSGVAFFGTQVLLAKTRSSIICLTFLMLVSSRL